MKTTLGDLLSDTDERFPGILTDRPASLDAEVRRVTERSDEVSSGSVFVAIQGSSTDGHRFIESAFRDGAVAAVVDRTYQAPTDVEPSWPLIRTTNGRLVCASMAASVAGHPSKELELVGVTGTNGKTTIVSLVAHICASAQRSARPLGTLTGPLTTASAPSFQRTLRSMVDQGVEIVAAEVSSHALHQHRVAATDFAVAVFSNLSQDHLDYHGSMESYFEAKAQLFDGRARHGVINVSDPWGARLADRLGNDETMVGVDVAAVADSAETTVQHSRINWRGEHIELPLIGRFNIENAVLAAEAALRLGLSVQQVVVGLESAPAVPGRFAQIDRGQPFGVFVDYAHTPAGVASLLSTTRLVTEGRIILVFGAGGDRDQTKREPMGLAATAADVVIITSDNPRSEDPEQIAAAVGVGLVDHPRVDTIIDRRTAIAAALDAAQPDDVVLIAGKGHENYQEINGERLPFDDTGEVEAALLERGWEGVNPT